MWSQSVHVDKVSVLLTHFVLPPWHADDTSWVMPRLPNTYRTLPSRDPPHCDVSLVLQDVSHMPTDFPTPSGIFPDPTDTGQAVTRLPETAGKPSHGPPTRCMSS